MKQNKAIAIVAMRRKTDCQRCITIINIDEFYELILFVYKITTVKI